MGPNAAPPNQDSTEQEVAPSRRAEELRKGMLYNILYGFSL